MLRATFFFPEWRSTALQFGELRMNQRRVAIKVQGAGHLGGGAAARASPGHGPAGRNAARRKEEVAVAGLEPAIEVEGELVLPATSGAVSAAKEETGDAARASSSKNPA